MKLTPSPRSAALIAAVVSVGALPFLTAPAQAADSPTTTYTKALSYTCDVDAQAFGGEIFLPNFPITATVSFAVPAVKPGGTVAPTKVDVALRLPEALRAASTGILSGVAADGSSSNVYLIEKSLQGERQVFEIPKLTAERSDIPTEANAPWVINASGQTPEIAVLNTTRVSISAPEKFNIDATIYRADDTSAAVRLTCETESDRTVASVPVGEATTAKIVAPTRIKAGAASSVKVQVRGAATKPTGTVYLFLDNNLESGFAGGDLNANGDVRIPLPKFGKTGTRKLTAVYQGDGTHGALTTTQTFTVTR